MLPSSVNNIDSISVPDGSVAKASISPIWNLLSMIWRSWVRTPIQSNLWFMVFLSKPYLNQKYPIMFPFLMTLLPRLNLYFCLFLFLFFVICYAGLFPVLPELQRLQITCWWMMKWLCSGNMMPVTYCIITCMLSFWSIFFTSEDEGSYDFTSVSLSVCLWAQ